LDGYAKKSEHSNALLGAFLFSIIIAPVLSSVLFRASAKEWHNLAMVFLVRNGDLLFDLFGSATGPLSDDLDVIVSDIGVGFDGQVVERNGPPEEQHHCHSNDEQTVA
jgi:hypothetical protein